MYSKIKDFIEKINTDVDFNQVLKKEINQKRSFMNQQNKIHSEPQMATAIREMMKASQMSEDDAKMEQNLIDLHSMVMWTVVEFCNSKIKDVDINEVEKKLKELGFVSAGKVKYDDSMEVYKRRYTPPFGLLVRKFNINEKEVGDHNVVLAYCDFNKSFYINAVEFL